MRWRTERQLAGRVHRRLSGQEHRDRIGQCSCRPSTTNAPSPPSSRRGWERGEPGNTDPARSGPKVHETATRARRPCPHFIHRLHGRPRRGRGSARPPPRAGTHEPSDSRSTPLVVSGRVNRHAPRLAVRCADIVPSSVLHESSGTAGRSPLSGGLAGYDAPSTRTRTPAPCRRRTIRAIASIRSVGVRLKRISSTGREERIPSGSAVSDVPGPGRRKWTSDPPQDPPQGARRGP